MKVTKFWAKGYRSLKDVELDGLGDFNVFYGPNGSGKSNVLAAIDTLLRAPVGGVAGTIPPVAIVDRDFFGQAPTPELRLGAVIEFDPGEISAPPKELVAGNAIQVEVTFVRSARNESRLSDFWVSEPGGARFVAQASQTLAVWWSTILAPRAFNFLPGSRVMGKETEPLTPPDGGDPVLDEVRAGRIKTALFNAKNSPDGAVLARYEEMRALMSARFQRPTFNATRDPRTRIIELVEALPGPNPESFVVPIQQAGSGAEQLYSIIAMVLFAQKRIIAIDEPEAHLHAPTTGRRLRNALASMLEDHGGKRRILDQLFIATHSNLFDLDPAWYWDVSLVEGATHIERRPLDDLDARHFYEPGPAKHALLRSLEYLAPDTVVFRQLADGAPITAAAMCDLLRRDAREADDYLAAVYGNAVRSVRRLAQTSMPPKPETST